MTILTTLALISSLFFAGNAAEETVPVWNSLAESCRLTFPASGVEADLCPLFENGFEGFTEYKNESIVDDLGGGYRWSLAGPLSPSGHRSIWHECGNNAWVCRMNFTDNVVVPLVGSWSPIPEPALQISATWERHQAEVVAVRLHGIPSVPTSQMVEFHFVCDVNAAEPSYPLFFFASPQSGWSEDNTNIFIWTTRHACVHEIETPTHISITNEEATGDENTPDESAPEESLRPVRPYPGLPRGGALVATLAGVIVLIGLAMLPPAWTARVRGVMAKHPLAGLYRVGTFRVGERTLVQWAGEETVDLEGQEDEWVNAQRPEEEIPLAPTPRTPGWVGIKTYGSR